MVIGKEGNTHYNDTLVSGALCVLSSGLGTLFFPLCILAVKRIRTPGENIPFINKCIHYVYVYNVHLTIYKARRYIFIYIYISAPFY